MADYDDSILEKVKRLAMGQGLTEGGILKALAEAANELKRSDYQFERRMGLEERQIKNQEAAATQAQEQQYIVNWITGLSGLGAFGKPGTPDVTTLKYDAAGKPMGKETVQGQQGTPNWYQKFMNALQPKIPITTHFGYSGGTTPTPGETASGVSYVPGGTGINAKIPVGGNDIWSFFSRLFGG